MCFKLKLLTAICKDGIIHFDDDGRVYELNPLLNSYIGTNKFVHLDYYRVPMCMLPPEYVVAGGYDPLMEEAILTDVSHEIIDE